MIRVLIVDDEPLARERIRTLLAADEDVEICGEYADGRAAAAAILELGPDLVFLDVQMPEMDGFRMIESLGSTPLPVIVFVTAFDQYAIDAFSVCALDYLLKPFDRQRFERALARGRAECANRETTGWNQELHSLLTEYRTRAKYIDRLVIRSAGRVFFLRTEELDWIEAAGNYVRLHCGRDSYLHRESLSKLETSLDPRKFVRIHRSTMVNVDRVKEMHPMFRGDFTVTLLDGRELTLSRSYRDRLDL